MTGFEQYQAEYWTSADGTTRHVQGRASAKPEHRPKVATFAAFAALTAVAFIGQSILPMTATQPSITLGAIAGAEHRPLSEYNLVAWPAADYWNRQIVRIEAWPKTEVESESAPPPIF